jgi:hypothetical protein
VRCDWSRGHEPCVSVNVSVSVRFSRRLAQQQHAESSLNYELICVEMELPHVSKSQANFKNYRTRFNSLFVWPVLFS